MDPAKLQAINNWPTPTSLKDIQCFLGFCNFYHCFIQKYSHVAHPLFLLTRQDTKFLWSNSQASAFTSLKLTFQSSPVLTLPDPSCPYHVITNASNFTLGAILEQPDLLNCWHPLTFYSKAMQPTKLNYDVHDKELLAIICALEYFCHYLKGNSDPFKVWTDHNNLTYFRTKQKHSHQQACWALFLLQYHFTIL